MLEALRLFREEQELLLSEGGFEDHEITDMKHELDVAEAIAIRLVYAP